MHIRSMGRGASESTLDTPVARRGAKADALDGSDRYEQYKRDHINILYLTDKSDVKEAAYFIKRELKPSGIGLDLETAAKAGRFGSFNGAIRTIQIGLDEPERGIRPVQFLLDCFSVDPTPILPLLRTENVEKQIHYMDFEQEWAMLHLGITIGNVYDTCIAMQVIQKKLKDMPIEEAQKLIPGWEKHNNKLSTLAELYMGLELPKENQASDWGREILTPDQKVYAAMDVAIMPGEDGLAGRLKEIAERVGVTEDIESRIAWVTGKIKDRVAKAKESKDDDAKRLTRAVKRTRTREELERVVVASRQMTLLADNAEAFADLVRERRADLVA